MPIFIECILPYDIGTGIDQDQLNREIASRSFETFPQADTIVGIVYDFCNNGKRLVIQLYGKNFNANLLFDSCCSLISKDLVQKPDSTTRLTFEN